jgi:hypothetical protein
VVHVAEYSERNLQVGSGRIALNKKPMLTMNPSGAAEE